MKNLRNINSILAAIMLAALLGACSDNATEPEKEVESYQAGHFTRDDLTAEGNVVETDNGYTVKGALHVETKEGKTSFVDADLDVEFDEEGRLRNVTGTCTVPSPHERIEFADPVQADVGFFSGEWLNENREFIPLKEDTDYFVFNIAVTFEMRVATGETGEDATKPLVLKAPLGGQILLIMDFNDPMYYAYAAQDLIGNIGVGWSLHSRIPFIPNHPVEGLGYFDGQNTRVGSMTVFKILSVSGQIVDNEYTELHLYEDDPLASDLRRGYQQGINGAVALDLFVKDIVGIDLPLGDASGGVFGEGGIQGQFEGHAYVAGVTSDFSWWPQFVPFKPASKLDAKAFLKDTGEFEVDVFGQYGWELPSGTHAMNGRILLNNDEFTLTGGVISGDITLQVKGSILPDATEASVTPPQELIDAISGRVNNELDDRIAEAEQAWEDLQDATGDYEFELSLRGLRSSIPGACDTAHNALKNGIANELKKHEGEVYYNQLKSHLHSKDNAYYTAIANLKASAQEIRDNDTTRRQIEDRLRALAAKKIFTTKFEYKVLGRVVKTVNVSKRIMSNTQANQLITAANNVKYIKETWDRKVRMQDIYDSIPDKQIFENVKDDIQNGIVVIPNVGEMGFEMKHDDVDSFEVYVMIDGKRESMGNVDVFSVPEMIVAVSSFLVDTFIAE